MKALSPALMAVAFGVAAPAIAGLTVRVGSRNGAPRLLVNGEPVRGRLLRGCLSPSV
ncbi:MAG TPA: hypothetical protein VLH79_01550 [Chthonomonadales bacterium]|nr:hypothetical protein [Chthonomonadales bacterium]